MKLDKYKFAALVSFISVRAKYVLSTGDLEDIDNLVDIEVPHGQTPDKTSIDTMLKHIVNNRKIDAIKSYRMIFGASLKDAKDAIEGNSSYF